MHVTLYNGIRKSPPFNSMLNANNKWFKRREQISFFSHSFFAYIPTDFQRSSIRATVFLFGAALDSLFFYRIPWVANETLTAALTSYTCYVLLFSIHFLYPISPSQNVSWNFRWVLVVYSQFQEWNCSTNNLSIHRRAQTRSNELKFKITFPNGNWHFANGIAVVCYS